MTSTAPTQTGEPRAADHLLRTVRELWPQHTVRLVGRADRRPGDLLVVPNAEHPRLVVPSGATASSAALRRFSRSLGVRERASRSAAGLVLRAGGSRLLPDRIRVTGDPDAESIQTHLSEVLGQPVQVSLGIGSARANQKPVLEVFDRHGRSLAFVKIGDTPRTVDLVGREAVALRRLATVDWSTVAPPQLLHLGSWQGLEVLVMTSLPSSVRPDRGPLERPPADALAEIDRLFAAGLAPIHETRFWRDLRRTAGAVDARTFAEPEPGDDELSGRLVAQLDHVAELFPAPVRLTAWHGDFAPWNMSRVGRRMMVWDWERFDTDVPAHLDAVHHVVHTLARENGFSVATIDRALASPDIPRTPLAGGVGLMYLCSITTRYLSGSHGPEGRVILPSARVALDALERRTRRDTGRNR